ncbi:MAG: ATP synthase F1 subunit epsilon [Flavobacteriales bacterium]|nr:ATP synthase F1 subunit epsilon [Flavobacteriales bacterium]|tara:strand:+ start:11876 stop:12112 length:237 start_codon:yes stop_codon:yes gene_type:complete
MKIEIITPDVKLFEGEVSSVMLPGFLGSFQILNHHAPIISSLTSGSICVSRDDREDKIFQINGGVVEMQNNTIVILAD